MMRSPSRRRAPEKRQDRRSAFGPGVQGIERSYTVARAAPPSAPLLLVLHGMGIGGTVMAEWTGLARRGPAAGFATVFPDGSHEMWDDTGLGRPLPTVRTAATVAMGLTLCCKAC